MGSAGDPWLVPLLPPPPPPTTAGGAVPLRSTVCCSYKGYSVTRSSRKKEEVFK